MNRRKNKEDFIQLVIDKMFVIAGYPTIGHKDIKDRKDAWFREYTMTEKQDIEWKKFFIENILYYKIVNTKKLAEKEFRKFSGNYGLMVEEDKVLKICKHCSSERVKKDFYSSWNVITQKWELESVFDQGYCEECDGETTIIDKLINNKTNGSI